MKRIVHKSGSFKEAELWEIEQYKAMTPAERQEIARALRIRYFGKNCTDVREYHRKNSGEQDDRGTG